MVYVIVIVILVASVVFYLSQKSKTTQKEQGQRIRDAWGIPKKEHFNFYLISKYATAVGSNTFHRLSGQTLTDMDFNDLFSFIDRTSSKVGQQYLFDKVLHPSNDRDALQKLSENADFFTHDSTLRLEIQRELARLNNYDAYYISSLLQDKLLERPTWIRFIPISIVITILLLAFSIKFPVLLIVLIVPVSVNMLIHYWNKENIHHFIISFPQLNILIDVCHKVSKKHIRFADQSAEESVSDLKPFQQKLVLLGSNNDGGLKGELSQLATYFIDLLKAIFLIEVFTLFDLIERVEKQRESLLILFIYLGEIDAALSVASLRAGALKTCRPEVIAAEKIFAAKNVYHPLINNCVPNDINIRSRSVLITGSNMSGKTTFLRTLIVNSILAQTIYTCFADSFQTPIVKQFSSIRIDDSLLEGTSYYFEEVNTMGALINEAASSNQNMFVLDEVFKGTNTVERIASAKAILSYLNRNNNLVIVSTHDIELSRMLEKEYDLFHFVETIQNNKFHFDHKIKPGTLRTRNAIRILEMSNYPEEIIREAQQISKVLDGGPVNNTRNDPPQ